MLYCQGRQCDNTTTRQCASIVLSHCRIIALSYCRGRKYDNTTDRVDGPFEPPYYFANLLDGSFENPNVCVCGGGGGHLKKEK